MIVYKYGPLTSGINEFQLPEKTEFLCIKEQNNAVILWCKHEESITKNFRLLMVPTGLPTQGANNLRYVDTVIMENGLVFHGFLIED